MFTQRPSELFALHGSDKHTGTQEGHSYGAFYDALLIPRQHTVKAVLELGVLGGASLKAWRDFFPNAEVVGIDNNCEPFTDGRIRVARLDATDKEALEFYLGEQKFDLIVDDASHWEGDQIRSWDILRHFLTPGGLYVVEDIQCHESHVKFAERGFEIHDFRHVRHRFDDVVAVFTQPGTFQPSMAGTRD